MAKNSGLFTPGFLLINLQFAAVTAIAAIFFVFSGYLQQLGINPATSGFIISADALAALIIQPLISPFVQAATARRWLLGGALLLALSLLTLSQTSSVAMLIIGRLAQGSGFICVLAALIAMIVNVIPAEMSGRAFGWISLVRLIPYAVVPLLFDLLRIPPAAFSSVLLVAAAVALLPAACLLIPSSSITANAPPPPGYSGMAASLKSLPVLLLLVSSLLFFSAYSVIFFFLKQFGPQIGISNVSLFFTIATIIMIVVRLFGGGLFDRYNKPLLCVAGLTATALVYAALPFCHSTTMFYLLAAVTGLGWGIAMPLQAAVMFDISPPNSRAMNQNLLIATLQGGFFIGPFAGGALIDSAGYTPLFIAIAALTAISAVLMLTIKRATVE